MRERIAEQDTSRTNLLGRGLEGLLGEGNDALNVDDGLLAEGGGEAHHLRADAGVGAGDEHALHGAHALAQDDEGHLLADRTDSLRGSADKNGATRGVGVEVADLGPQAAGDGLGLDLLDGDIAVVGREGVLGVRRLLLLLLALRRFLGLLRLPGVLLLLLLAERSAESSSAAADGEAEGGGSDDIVATAGRV